MQSSRAEVCSLRLTDHVELSMLGSHVRTRVRSSGRATLHKVFQNLIIRPKLTPSAEYLPRTGYLLTKQQAAKLNSSLGENNLRSGVRGFPTPDPRGAVNRDKDSGEYTSNLLQNSQHQHILGVPNYI